MILPATHASQPSHERTTRERTAASRFDAVRQWSAGRIHAAHRVGAIPLAGSPGWLALDDADPRKTAAILRAALAWLHEATHEVIADRLGTELDLIDRCHTDRMTAVACDVSAAADWTRIAAGPTLRELTRRRTTYPCPDCRSALRLTDTRCAACGWVEPTPDEQRDAARRSWAPFDRRQARVAAA